MKPLKRAAPGSKSQAAVKGKKSAKAPEKELVILPGIPDAPTALTINLVVPEVVELRWQSTGADSFRVFRATNPDLTDLQWIATVTQPLFQDSVVADPEFQRYYQVTAVNNP